MVVKLVAVKVVVGTGEGQADVDDSVRGNGRTVGCAREALHQSSRTWPAMRRLVDL